MRQIRGPVSGTFPATNVDSLFLLLERMCHEISCIRLYKLTKKKTQSPIGTLLRRYNPDSLGSSFLSRLKICTKVGLDVRLLVPDT